MILSYENIEHIAAGVAKDFCCAIHAGEKKYEINIDRVIRCCWTGASPCFQIT